MAVLTEDQFAKKWGDKAQGKFADNEIQNFNEPLFREFQQDINDSFVPRDAVPDLSNNAVFLKQENGQTTFALSFATRILKRLRLRRFTGGTLPAVLPAPVLDPNRPVGIKAPGAAFTLHSSIGGPASGPAAIAEYTRQVSDGGQFLLTGADLDKAAYPVYQSGNFYATTVTSQHSQRASVRLPRVGAAWDAALTWASTAAGISEPVLLNTAVLLWGTEQTAVGLTFSIHGRNLANGNVAGGASYLAVQPVGGGPVQLLTGTALDAYCADFVTPNLALGDYHYWPHNGHGGEYGWGERGLLTVVAPDNHVLTHNFGPPTYVKLDPNDAAANVAIINQAFVDYPHFCTDEGSFPINAHLYPRDERKWSCLSPTGHTELRATSWDPKSQYGGMFGSNLWYMGMLERISFLDPDDVVPYKTKPGFYNQSLIDLRRATGSSGNEHIWLKDVEAKWLRPYYEINMGTYSIPEEAQCLHVEGARHFFLDKPRITGSGSHFGNCGQVFITDYWHRLRNGADHTLYGLHVNGFSVRGFDFQDDNPTSGNGVTRGAGRGPKFGGQGGSNQNTYLRDLNGRLLGPLFTGINPYFDRNQGEMCLYEGNRVVWQNMVVSATATTITFAGPVLSDPAAVANGTSSPDKPAVGVLPDYHLLWIGRGRGIDQVRGIVSVNGNTITLDKPLRVIPDATSFVQVGTFTRGNTLSKVKLTGKRNIVDDADFGIQCAINFYGGMFDTIADDFDVTDTRHGFIFTPTVHGDGQIDTVAFCQMLNSTFTGQRWVERYESYGKEEELFWSFGCSGLRNILVANIEASNWLEARVVFKVVREASELATYWRPDAPPVDGLTRDGMPVVAGYLNDYRTPAGPTKFPPIPLVAGVVEGFVQQPVQQPVALGTPGTVLVAGTELGPLEPLPATANIDTYGLLTYPESAQHLLVLLDSKQRPLPLDRTRAATSASSPTTPGAATGYTDAEIDAFLRKKADEDDRFKNISGADPALPDSAITELLKLLSPGHALELVNGKLGLVKSVAGIKLPPPMGIGAFDMGTGTLNHGYLDMYYSDYIAIEPGVAIEFANGPYSTPNLQFTAVYDANKVFLGSIYDIMVAGGNGFVAPANAAFMRLASGITKRSFVLNAYSDITYTLGRFPYLRSLNGLFPGPDGNLDMLLGGPGGLPLPTTRTADYTLALTDADKMVSVSSSSAVVVTVPAHADVPFRYGTEATTLYVAQDGVGSVTIAAAPGVVIHVADSSGYKVPGQWLDVALHKRDMNTWVLKGGV